MNKQWWKEAVVYQVYPRSFCDSNNDGIGDINGITQKLDYLKDLGIDVIWISPIYQSPNMDNGYDISDYKSIMAEFGTMADFDNLLSEAHKRNLRIVMDLVVNHTSDEHEWFVKSKSMPDSPYRDYYIWKRGQDGRTPNNWGSWFYNSAWEYEHNMDMYYLHIFTKNQPDLNWENPLLRNEIYSMMTWWLDKGVDGFRMDVISLISKSSAYSDGEVTGVYGAFGDLTPYCENGPHVHEYLQEMNKKVLSKYDIMTVGETPNASVDDAAKYTNKSAKMLATCLHMLQGTPYIYQGQEIGMTNPKYESFADYKDVEAKNAYVDLVEVQKIMTEEKFLSCVYNLGRDNARTPMQWDGTKYAGFSKEKPWMKVNPDYK